MAENKKNPFELAKAIVKVALAIYERDVAKQSLSLGQLLTLFPEDTYNDFHSAINYLDFADYITIEDGELILLDRAFDETTFIYD